MTDYRLYLLDIEGHIRRAVDLECEDDGEAVETARRQVKDAPMELWQGARVVRKFDAADSGRAHA